MTVRKLQVADGEALHGAGRTGMGHVHGPRGLLHVVMCMPWLYTTAHSHAFAAAYILRCWTPAYERPIHTTTTTRRVAGAVVWHTHACCTVYAHGPMRTGAACLQAVSSSRRSWLSGRDSSKASASLPRVGGPSQAHDVGAQIAAGRRGVATCPLGHGSIGTGGRGARLGGAQGLMAGLPSTVRASPWMQRRLARLTCYGYGGSPSCPPPPFGDRRPVPRLRTRAPPGGVHARLHARHCSRPGWQGGPRASAR